MIASWFVVIEYKLHTARTCSVGIPNSTSNPSGIAQPRQGRCNGTMGSKSREVIYGGRIIGARIRAEGAQEAAQKAVREADRAAAELWSIQMEALWRAGAALANDRAMPQWRLWLATRQMPSL
jgi:hypothetical protein